LNCKRTPSRTASSAPPRRLRAENHIRENESATLQTVIGYCAPADTAGGELGIVSRRQATKTRNRTYLGSDLRRNVNVYRGLLDARRVLFLVGVSKRFPANYTVTERRRNGRIHDFCVYVVWRYNAKLSAIEYRSSNSLSMFNSNTSNRHGVRLRRRLEKNLCRDSKK